MLSRTLLFRRFVLLALLVLSVPAGAAPPPRAALEAMRPGGVSLRWESLWLGPDAGDVFLHLYVVPAGRASDSENGRSSGVIEREEITTELSLLPSPFFLDIFERPRDGGLRRVNSVSFTQDKDANRVVVRWLHPARRRGPVLLLDFGSGHWREWIVMAFPDSLAAEPTVQRFLWGGEGEEISTLLRFDGVDKRGLLQIREDWREEGRRGTRFHTWNGFEFRDPAARYFVIGAQTKTRAEAEAFLRRERLPEAAEVQPSGRYPRLKPGHFIVLLSRHHSRDEAAAMARSYRKDGVRAEVQAAF